MMKRNIALIPARSGSKRLPGKNIKLLGGIPLLAYSINSAQETCVFDEIIVSTDDQVTADISKQWGARVPLLRPIELASDSSSDIEWVLHAIENMVSVPEAEIGLIAILRPTNPLRTSASILRAIDLLGENPWADSIRAMEPANLHPGKMWTIGESGCAIPFINQKGRQIPTYNLPTQTLPEVWVQNASLEIVRRSSLLETRLISGRNILPIRMPGLEGYDINSQDDWDYLEFLILKHPDLLPKIV